MAKHISLIILDNIINTIGRFPQGASINDIFHALDFPKRSVQRYISILIAEGRLKKTGKARSTLYHLVVLENIMPIADNINTSKKINKIISLSAASSSIEKNVRRPIQARHPVGYNHEFLNKYRPNQTCYLSDVTRKHLLEIGKSPIGERPAGTYARQILSRLLIDLSWNSSRLEGNTYSLLETERLLELGEATEGKDSMEAQMILNHKSAIEFMVELAEQMKFNRFTILNLHALLSNNLLRDQRACGSLRLTPVGIAKSVYQPLAIPPLIEEYFQQILDTANAIKNPFEQSFFAMVHLPYLQPFLDVNKRVSRLAANIPLIRKNLCPLSFVDVPEDIYVSGLLGVYELNRVELLSDVYVWAYERSCALYSATRQELGEPDPFRFKYRNLIMVTIGDIVNQCLNKKMAVIMIKQNALEIIIKEDQQKFVEVIEIELMSLHEGNIARYRLKLSAYRKWLKTWN